MALEDMVGNSWGSGPIDVYCAACENLCHAGGRWRLGGMRTGIKVRYTCQYRSILRAMLIRWPGTSLDGSRCCGNLHNMLV